MKLSTFKLLVPIVAVTLQSNSSSTVIPPYLDHLRIPVALIGTLISLGPVFALMARLPIGMLYSRARPLAGVRCDHGDGTDQLLLQLCHEWLVLRGGALSQRFRL
ncbi:MAG: hypothetical protein ACXWZE_07845 [Candidatus Binatia bacterium]